MLYQRLKIAPQKQKIPINRQKKKAQHTGLFNSYLNQVVTLKALLADGIC